jgi:RNA polymerase sigma-70 factor, ECF subfamily
VTGAPRNQRFEQAALPHLEAAYELARWLTGSSHDAEDVVQEAYLRAFQFFDGWRGDNARAWLLAIVRNTAMSWLGRNRPKHVATMAPEALAVASDLALQRGELPAANPEQNAIALAERSELLHALESLPPPFREVIVLRELQDLSYREIAEIVGAPVGTVMSRLARARIELRRLWLKRDR